MHSDPFFASFLAASVCALEAFVQFPKPFESYERCLAASIGKFGGFFFLRCPLTIDGAFAVVSASISMLGTSLFPLNTFACPPPPFVTSTLHPAPPVPRYVSAPLFQCCSTSSSHHPLSYYFAKGTLGEFILGSSSKYLTYVLTDQTSVNFGNPSPRLQ